MLQTIILDDKNMSKDSQCLTNFSHTGSLEIYHALQNKWLPKRQHFSRLVMVTSSQLAVMNFNSGSDLEQAKTMEGKERFNYSFSKVTHIWSVKPIPEKRDDAHLCCMMDRTIKVIKEKTELKLPD